MEWINQQIKRKRFKDVSHSIGHAVCRLKEETDEEKK